MMGHGAAANSKRKHQISSWVLFSAESKIIVRFILYNTPRSAGRRTYPKQIILEGKQVCSVARAV